MLSTQKQRRARRPTLSREELQIIPLWVELGARPSDIAEALGMSSVNSLFVACSKHKISLRPSREAFSSEVTPQRLVVLQREAFFRGVSISRLVASILVAIVDYDLFVAVLGDSIGASEAKQPRKEAVE